METSTISLADFEKQCKNFDFTYEYSDDYNVYRKWSAIHDKLKAISAQSPEYREVYNRYF